MPCYHPMRAFKVGISDETGKAVIVIESKRVSRIRAPKGKITERGQYNLRNCWTDKFITEYQEVPCGKCIGCRLDYSRQWATRCMLEAEQWKDNQFIALTYDPEHLPVTPGVTDDGEITMVGTLVPEDLQKFFKRLRIEYKRKFNWDNIRFYACGEYGDEHQRPHYHAIIFNLPVPDKEFWFTNKSHQKVYRSAMLEKIWGKGIVSVGDVTWESAAYVARYIMKKQKGPDAKEYYKQRGKVPEFVRMSRRPGLALNYYEDNKGKIYECDEIYVKNKKGVIKLKPSKYYDNKFDIEEPELMAAIKEKRQHIAKEALKIKLEKTSLNEEEYRELQERNKEASLKKLIRPMHAI